MGRNESTSFRDLCKLHLHHVKTPLWHRHLSSAPTGAIRVVLSALCSHSPSLQGASCSIHVPNCFGINSAKPHTTELGRRQLPAPGRGDLAGGWIGCTASPPGLLPRAGGNGSGCSSCPKALQPWDHWRREEASAHLQWLLNVTCATKGSRDQHWC